jgi:hypothetical protein
MAPGGRWRLITTVFALSGYPMPVCAQELPEPSVHWAYASFFGTGWYQLGERQSAFILNMTPRWTTGDADWLASGDRKPVYTLRVPFTVGVNQLDFEDVPGILDPDNVSTVSVGLSADIDIPLTPRFSIRPNAQVGYGTVINGGDDAWTYLANLRARYTFQTGNLDWFLIGAAGVVGYEAGAGVDDSFTYAALGAEFAYPVSWFSSADSQTVLYWHLVYTDLLNRIEVQTSRDQFDEITNYWQAGIAFGKQGRRMKFWFLSFDRLGLAYDLSPSGDLRGIKFVFRSLYEP